MSFDMDEKNSSNSMIVKDILNEFPFDKSECKEEQKELNGISISRVIDLDKYENLLQILKCKICLNILLNPYDCSKCGNSFCFSCINKLKESDKACPFGCTDYEIMPSSFAIKKFLNQLHFTCLNKENGCNEIISYNNIEQHDKNCEYINSICPNNQCCKKLPWYLLKNHLQNECLYTLFECEKCHLKLNRKELEPHNKLCSAINKEFENHNVIMNKMTKDDLIKKKEEFTKFINGIENLNFFNEENNKENNNKIEQNIFNNSDMNLLVKSLIFIFSRKMNFIEDKINKINNTLQQFSENNLIFYQSINDELDNINEKISNLNNKENTSNKNSTSKSNNNNTNNNNTITSEYLSLGFNSPTIKNTKKNYNKTIFPNKEEKILLSNTIINERQKSVKTLDKFKTSYPNEFMNSTKNRSKKKILNINDKINSRNTNDKNKINVIKKGETINNLYNKEKFIQGMKSTKYMEKLKGIQAKKQNLLISTGNLDNKIKNEYINTNIINGQRNNYIISNNFNTINSFHDNTYSEKSSSKGIEQSISEKNNQDLINNNNCIK